MENLLRWRHPDLGDLPAMQTVAAAERTGLAWDRLLVSAMTGIARGRGPETIGEGIETQDQLVALIDTGCDLGQGYLFARPLEREHIQTLATLESALAATIRLART